MAIYFLDVECMSVPPSVIAAASMLLAMQVDGKNWDATLEHYSDYNAKSLSKYAERLRRVSVHIIIYSGLIIMVLGVGGVGAI